MATAMVTLDIALAELPKEERTVKVTSEPATMADTVLECLSFGGWPALLELIEKVEAHRIGELTQAVYDQANEAVYEIVPQLVEIEQRAREIVDARLDISEEQVQAARETFLAGPGVATLPISYLRGTRWRLTLRPGPHLVALRSMLIDLGPSNKVIEQERRSVGSQIDYASRNSNLRYIVDKGVLHLRAFELRRAERVQQVTQYWPLAAWLVGTDPAISDKALLARILEELEIVTDAIDSVRKDVRDGGQWPADTVTGEQSGAGLTSSRLFLGTNLTNPFTRNMPTPRGPWRYPLVIDAAMTELGHRPPSAVHAAARSVTHGSDEYDGLSHLVTGVNIAVGIAAPPVGVALGVVSALWNLFHDASQYSDQSDAHRAVLDPAQSLAVPPSIRAVEASVVGLVGSAVPGLVPALVFGAAETVMRVNAQATP
ncbi:hypothetical protein U2F25_22120 [Micromonospora sp. 4G53]|uniref:Uncharacterized protein n=1 Tax=Micromonospora sicca TaxID=2202420 RepID=A0ABU5JHM6_9ACTN|nr:hypothetical protein [Micromonospora sp. 4G53]